MRNASLIFLTLLFFGCIGTDEVDDPIIGEKIRIEIEQLALLVGETGLVSATYFDQYGIEQDVQLLWTSDDPSVAEVDISGLVTAIGSGQARLKANFGATESRMILVTVVETENEVAQITISSPQGTQIAIDQSISLNVSITNIQGEEIEGLEVSFQTTTPDYISVNADGLVTGLANGFGLITASIDGIESNELGIQVGSTSRTGTFQSAGGYDTEGTTELSIDEDGDLILVLNTDFSTDFALGTYIYLSNSTSGTVTRNEGLEIQEITSGGFHSFNVSNVEEGVNIDDYEYVIVLCKPAGITFGYAQLN